MYCSIYLCIFGFLVEQITGFKVKDKNFLKNYYSAPSLTVPVLLVVYSLQGIGEAFSADDLEKCDYAEPGPIYLFCGHSSSG